MTRLNLSLVLLAAMVLAGCGGQSAEDELAAMEAVRRNVQAMQSGNVDEVLATVHPQSPGYAQTRGALESLFGRFQLSCELEELAIESFSPGTVRVRFAQVTDKVSGDEDFQKNRLRGVHVLKKDGAAWKLWHTEVGKMEPL